jgi:nitrate reductase delta subunit
MDSGQATTSGMTLGSFARSPARLAAVERVQDWTRARFALAEDTVIVAAEIACQVPGCPPIETVIAFWTGEGTRYRFKIFKPVAEVVADDLPVAWLLPSLIDYGDLGCDCC